MEKKMIFFDIDGTLIEVKKNIYKIQPEVENAMNKLKEEGHEVFLATGRSECFIVDGVSYYPFTGLVSCNGGRVDYLGKPIYRNIVPSDAIKATMDLSKHYDMNYYFENKEHIYIRDKKDPLHREFAKQWGMKDKVCVDQFNPDLIETYIGMIVCKNLKDIPVMKEKLSPYFQLQQHRSPYSYDLTLKDTSKAKGIEKMVEKMGRSMKNTIAFGDGNNDVEMLQSVNLGIAMGNSMEAAKKSADYITTDIDEHGIVNALKHFNLI
jgi:Cof subfamily protein (haloacid dehalogenase superfamily)